MKKILSLLYTLTALLLLLSCFVGCGGDDTPAVLRTVSANLKSADPRSVTSVMTVTAPDGTVLPNMNATVSRENGDPTALNLVCYPTFSFDGNGNAVIPEDCKTSIAGNAAAGGEVTLGSLRFRQEYFKNEAYLVEADRFYAVISDVEGFFGMPIDGVNEVSIDITFDRSYPTELIVCYTTAAKVGVRIVMNIYY